MSTIKNTVAFILFGAAGDLAQRLILPALYSLYLHKKLPTSFRLIAVDRIVSSNQQLTDKYRNSISNYSEIDNSSTWQVFESNIEYIQGDMHSPELYKNIELLLNKLDKKWNTKSEKVFYFATPAKLFSALASGISNNHLNRDRVHSRIVVEKPLGNDLESFLEINTALMRHFQEQQIYRIDHFLGKETVQNILALRFANPIFEPIWNRNYIDHVVITVAETLGVEHRADYYEQAGALRDMVQNHLLQLLCLITMEPPAIYLADDIRNRKMDVMHALRPIPSNEVSRFAARGQYGHGWIDGQEVVSYRDEPNINVNSPIETYAALKLFVDNWRWQDIPFYLRTGKRMARAVSEISIRFRPVPHRAFPNALPDADRPVSLILRLQPDEGIRFRIYVKEPGTHFKLRTVNMDFSYRDNFKEHSPSAYETLLKDIMDGDASLFMRADQVESAWQLLTPVLEAWKHNPANDFPNYPAGSWGPETAETLIASSGHAWYIPEIGKK